MIFEFIEALRTPATPAARRLGYLYETIAFHQRFLRCSRSWESHLRQCHRVIDAATAASRGTLLIFGSGALLEIPMESLLKRFERVILVDLVHPRSVRLLWGRHPGVLLIELDLLGIAQNLLTWGPGQPLPVARVPDLRYLRPDFILSANCLSQLALLPRQHIESVGRGRIPADDLEVFSRDLSAAHLRHVLSFEAPHLIIADFETRLKDSKGAVHGISHPFFERHDLSLQREWPWTLAPRGEADRRFSIEMSVGAFVLKRE